MEHHLVDVEGVQFAGSVAVDRARPDAPTWSQAKDLAKARVRDADGRAVDDALKLLADLFSPSFFDDLGRASRPALRSGLQRNGSPEAPRRSAAPVSGCAPRVHLRRARSRTPRAAPTAVMTQNSELPTCSSRPQGRYGACRLEWYDFRTGSPSRPMASRPGLLQGDVGSLEPHRELAIVRDLGNDLVAAGFHEGAER